MQYKYQWKVAATRAEVRKNAAAQAIAEELGLLERVKEHGWKSLSAKETGRIGGLMTRRKRESENKI